MLVYNVHLDIKRQPFPDCFGDTFFDWKMSRRKYSLKVLCVCKFAPISTVSINLLTPAHADSLFFYYYVHWFNLLTITNTFRNVFIYVCVHIFKYINIHLCITYKDPLEITY